jgi:hypothetical protein
MGRTVPYAELAQRVNEAHAAVAVTAVRRRWRPDGALDREHPSIQPWEEAVKAFWAAFDAAYPAIFRENLDALAAADPVAIEAAIAFIQADPYFHRSGYLKAHLAHKLKRVPLAERQRDRLRDAIVHNLGRRGGQELRRYRMLSRELDEPVFRDRLEAMAAGPDEGARWRAAYVLAGMTGPRL